MGRTDGSLWRWMAAAVLSHLAVAVIHGIAHSRARVPLSPPANLFVLTVILAAPLAGLALTLPARRLGSWLVAASLAASFVFGLVNHFLLASPDHVAHVEPRVRPLFATTAVLLAVTEVVGSGLAVRLARERSLP